ncbi:MAG: hypothetical protein IJ265_09200, partial [Oscillospiraceae bacterium]|nr:hypothetical protein [Oscillospiraceae bacterium]
MRTYDEIVSNVVEATAAHRRKVKKIQRIASASAMCAACVLGLSVYLNLEPQQVLPESSQNETTTIVTGTVPTETETAETLTPTSG